MSKFGKLVSNVIESFKIPITTGGTAATLLFNINCSPETHTKQTDFEGNRSFTQASKPQNRTYYNTENIILQEFKKTQDTIYYKIDQQPSQDIKLDIEINPGDSVINKLNSGQKRRDFSNSADIEILQEIQNQTIAQFKLYKNINTAANNIGITDSAASHLIEKYIADQITNGENYRNIRKDLGLKSRSGRKKFKAFIQNIKNIPEYGIEERKIKQIRDQMIKEDGNDGGAAQQYNHQKYGTEFIGQNTKANTKPDYNKAIYANLARSKI